MKAINTPGAIPNIHNAWDLHVSNKCNEATTKAVDAYAEEMGGLGKLLPCDRDVIRDIHHTALEGSLKVFKRETFGISPDTVQEYLAKLTVSAKEP